MEGGRSEGNLLYLLHVYCDTLSRLLEKHGFTGFGKYVLPHMCYNHYAIQKGFNPDCDHIVREHACKSVYGVCDG